MKQVLLIIPHELIISTSTDVGLNHATSPHTQWDDRDSLATKSPHRRALLSACSYYIYIYRGRHAVVTQRRAHDTYAIDHRRTLQDHFDGSLIGGNLAGNFQLRSIDVIGD